MNQALAIREQALPMNATEVRSHVALIREVMQAVMKEGTHFGVIPGCDKPSLFQPGAEKLCVTFRIAPKFPSIEDLSTPDCVRYRVRCVGVHQMSGIELGEGVGECSSLEEKYKWRKAYKREWDEADPTRRRQKFGYSKKDRKEHDILQVRTEPADLANTVLKMAAKRAKVAMTLTVTAASDLFVQDLEDYEDLRNVGIDAAEQDGAPPVAGPQSRSGRTEQAPKTTPDPQAPAGMLKLIQAKAGQKNIDEAALFAHIKEKYQAESLEAIKVSQGNAVLAWIAEHA